MCRTEQIRHTGLNGGELMANVACRFSGDVWCDQTLPKLVGEVEQGGVWRCSVRLGLL